MRGVSRWFVSLSQQWQTLVQGRSHYPLFRQELAYWDTRLGGRWRIEEAFAMVTLGNLCVLPIALLIYPNLLLVYALLDEALMWFAALPSAALIVREREGQTWDILRSTPLEGAQIALNKLGGVLYLIWESVGYLASARWYGTWLALPLLALMLTLHNPFPFADNPSSWLGLFIIYLTFIYRPQLNLLHGGSLGLAVSALGRTSGEALAWVTILSGTNLFASVVALAWFYQRNGAAPFFSESVLAGRLESIFIWLIPLGVISLLRCALTPLCLWLAIGRLHHLND